MIVGRIISTFLLATIMMMVVGVFGGFNVHQPELGAPFAARGRVGGGCSVHWRKVKTIIKVKMLRH